MKYNKQVYRRKQKKIKKEKKKNYAHNQNSSRAHSISFPDIITESEGCEVLSKERSFSSTGSSHNINSTVSSPSVAPSQRKQKSPDILAKIYNDPLYIRMEEYQMLKGRLLKLTKRKF